MQTADWKKPECYDSYPGFQEQAENCCHDCPFNGDCSLGGKDL